MGPRTARAHIPSASSLLESVKSPRLMIGGASERAGGRLLGPGQLGRCLDPDTSARLSAATAATAALVRFTNGEQISSGTRGDRNRQTDRPDPGMHRPRHVRPGPLEQHDRAVMQIIPTAGLFRP
ncbi:hypothetical protein MAPG_02294 [Magnaporthiopsis poae ATCC 64411]|uniref:Uncharacterized protein n=1 Tax=Magnaporthiopsis poae (strain ATCC 64411 / 73-15) TaxID=644358 RepID=A0A0C4DQZ5_MAGP6|nr:hypothetical protein MAPG_02294 [Magnaporthiopsis poae ATCC 64411]